MSQSETIDKLAAALSKAQASVMVATRAAENPFFKSKYADLAGVWSACREALTTNGLAVVQSTEAGDGTTVTVRTILTHSSGQWISGLLTMKPTKTDPQGIGSAITYARRYGLAAMVGVATEDDDGNGASGNSGHAANSTPPPAQRATPKPTEKLAGKALFTKTVLDWANFTDASDKAEALRLVMSRLGKPNSGSVKEEEWSGLTAIVQNMKDEYGDFMTFASSKENK